MNWKRSCGRRRSVRSRTDDITVTRVVHPGTAKRSPSRGGDGHPPWTHHPHRRVGPTCSTPPGTPPAPEHRSTARPQWIRHAYHIPAPNPYADGEISVADALHASAAAPAWSTTGSRPVNSPPAAAPATGCASPGLSRSKPNAVAASPNPVTLTLPSAGPRPANTPNSPTVSGPTGVITPKDPADHRNSITDENIPTHDCRRGSMKHLSRQSGTGPPIDVFVGFAGGGSSGSGHRAARLSDSCGLLGHRTRRRRRSRANPLHSPFRYGGKPTHKTCGSRRP